MLDKLIKSIDRRFIIAFFSIVFFSLVIYACFIFQLSSFKTYVLKEFSAESATWHFNGALRLTMVKSGVFNEPGIRFEEAVFNFNPFLNLFGLSRCDASFISASPDVAGKIAQEPKKISDKISSVLKKASINSGRLEFFIKAAYNSKKFMNYTFDDDLEFFSSFYAFNFKDGDCESDQVNSSFKYANATGEVHFEKGGNGICSLKALRLPIGIFKKKLQSNFFDFNTAEITLRLKSKSDDLSNYSDFYDVEGEARNFVFTYVPFKSILKTNFNFKVLNKRFVIREFEEVNSFNDEKGFSRVSGFVDFVNGSLSVEFLSQNFDLSYFSNAFGKTKNFLSHYSPTGFARLFLKMEGAFEKPEVYGELNLSNAILQGDAGYKNINNMSGGISFINSKVTFNDLCGSLMSSKVNITGTFDVADAAGASKINVNFSDMSVKEIKECMIFSENEIDKLVSIVNEGFLSLNVKFISASANFNGSGNFSKCKLTLPVKNDVIEMSEVGGNVQITDDAIEFSDAYGFIGGVPFFFKGMISKKSIKDFHFFIKIHNLDFSEINATKSSFEFFNFISRIQAQNKSKLEMKIDSTDGITISNELSLNLSYPDISLYPLPFTLNIANVEGRIAFDYSAATNAFDLKGFDFKLKGDSKILILSFLYRTIPVSISGYLLGDIHLSQKKVITGNLSIPDGVIRYFDNKYAELFVKITDLNAYFVVSGTIINGICKLGLLGGAARLDFKSNFLSDALSSSLDFESENLNLNSIYENNGKIARYVEGLMNLKFKSVFNNKENFGGLVGNASLRNGRFSNLNRLDIISKKEIIPDSIYEFSKLNFKFSLNRGKLKLSEIVYEGSEKNDFLNIMQNIDYGVDL